jgi:hypothetical protein
MRASSVLCTFATTGRTASRLPYVPLGRLLVPRMLATGSVVTSATAFRMGASCLLLYAERTPRLFRRAVTASVGGADAAAAEATFRDDLIALARDSTEAMWRELRRGVDDLEAFTRPDEQPGARAHRPYRVKP